LLFESRDSLNCRHLLSTNSPPLEDLPKQAAENFFSVSFWNVGEIFHGQVALFLGARILDATNARVTREESQAELHNLESLSN
jgi:hypothetical protein